MRSDEIISEVRSFIEANLNFLGVNKKREIERLLFEIVKTNRIKDLSELPGYINYEQFKRALIKIRYPHSYSLYPLKSFFLGKLEIDYKKVWRGKGVFVEEIIFEKDLKDKNMVERFKKAYPYAKTNEIYSLKEYIKENQKKDFNYDDRKKKIYIVDEKYDFLKRCPCTKNCISCGYYIINLGFGCPMDCEYCFLAGYQNIDGIIVNTNVVDYIERIINFSSGRRVRVGSGEFTDSLVYDHITHHSKQIIERLRNHPEIIFEFKTKTSNTQIILQQKPSENIVISFSMNPSKISEMFEHGTASYSQRLKQLSILSKKGWKIAVHFDPVIITDGWRELYRDMISDIFSVVDPSDILWISAGTLRFYPQTKKYIEMRFPDSVMLDPEMVMDFDGKLRYPYDLRKDVYQLILRNLIKKGFDISRFYLCMEEVDMWKDIGLNPELSIKYLSF